MRKLLCVMFCCLAIFLSSCEVTYETITDKPGEYQYGMGEEVNIIDIETRDTLAKLSIVSCELVSDKPFSVEDDDDKTDVRKSYIGLYRVTCNFTDEKNFIKRISDHFSSSDSYFVVNPRNKDEEYAVFEIGVTAEYSGSDKGISLSFRYDPDQERATADFEIPIGEVVAGKDIQTEAEPVKGIEKKTFR